MNDYYYVVNPIGSVGSAFEKMMYKLHFEHDYKGYHTISQQDDKSTGYGFLFTIGADNMAQVEIPPVFGHFKGEKFYFDEEVPKKAQESFGYSIKSSFLIYATSRELAIIGYNELINREIRKLKYKISDMESKLLVR